MVWDGTLALPDPPATAARKQKLQNRFNRLKRDDPGRRFRHRICGSEYGYEDSTFWMVLFLSRIHPLIGKDTDLTGVFGFQRIDGIPAAGPIVNVLSSMI